MDDWRAALLTADWLTADVGHESCWLVWPQCAERISPIDYLHLYLHRLEHQANHEDVTALLN